MRRSSFQPPTDRVAPPSTRSFRSAKHSSHHPNRESYKLSVMVELSRAQLASLRPTMPSTPWLQCPKNNNTGPATEASVLLTILDFIMFGSLCYNLDLGLCTVGRLVPNFYSNLGWVVLKFKSPKTNTSLFNGV